MTQDEAPQAAVALDDVQTALEADDLDEAHDRSVTLWSQLDEQDAAGREALLALWLSPRWPLCDALRAERARLWMAVRDELEGAIALRIEGVEGGDAQADALCELWELFDGEDSARALEVLERAYSLAHSEAKRLDIGSWMAGPLMARGELTRAISLLEAALGAPELAPADEAMIRIDLAGAHLLSGDLAKASFVLPSREDIETIEDDILMLMRDDTEALIWTRRGVPTRAIALLVDWVDKFDDKEDSPYYYIIYNRCFYALANALIVEDILDVAEKVCELGLACAELTGQASEVARAALMLGQLHIMMCDYDAAHEALSRSLELAEQAGEQALATIARFMMGWAALSMAAESDTLTPAHFDALGAETETLRAIALAVRGDMLGEPDTLREAVELCRAVGLTRMEADALTDLAELVEPREAIGLLERALHLLIALASALDEQTQRLDILAHARRTGFLLAMRQLEQGQRLGCLATIHEIKAADFIRMLARQRGEAPALGALATAQLRIPSQAMHLWDQPTSQTARLLEGYLALVRDGAHTLPALVSPSRILANLAPDHAVIEYLWPGPDMDACILATMCSGDLKLTTIALPEALAAELDRVVELIRGERGEGSRVLALRLIKGLRAAHEALIAPALALLPRGVTKLTISPGAQLADVPFEALLDEADEALAARYTLTFVVSSAQLAVQSAPPSAPSAAVLWRPADALVYADQEDAWLGARLVQAGASVRRLTRWETGAGREAALIHYAGHAGFMGEARSEGGLEASSLVGERFGAGPLVVLSACETGRVQAHGEELVGFLRAVFDAGASALVCASWRAHDAATQALMQSFYEALLGGLPAPEALRHATQTLPTQQLAWRHPFFWACWRCWIGAAPAEARG